MNNKQRMTHPKLPGQEIFAGPRTQSSRIAAGWVLDGPATEKAPAGEPAASAKTVAPRGQTQES